MNTPYIISIVLFFSLKTGTKILADYDWCDDQTTTTRAGAWLGVAHEEKKSTSWADALTFPTFAPFFGVKT